MAEERTFQIELPGATTADLELLVRELGEPAYRGRQIAHWVYKKQAQSFSEMTDLPGRLRARLRELVALYRSRIITCQTSPDGAARFLLELRDGRTVESVLIPSPDRLTVCVSTQIGCAAGCVFCATAQDGLVRNLSAGEIVDQVLTLEREAGRRVTNVVFMGMGEPLLNYHSVLDAVRLLNREVGIAMRKMTISTAGIIPRIRDLASLNLQLTLAVSLHAPDDALRERLMPIARRYPLAELLAACQDYAERTGRRVTYEYLMIAGVNDSLANARKLGELLHGTLCNVNLIPYNFVPGKELERPRPSTIKAFRNQLESAGINVTQRAERGHAVSAACGQLRNACGI